MHAIFYLNHKIIQSEHRLQLVNTFWILWVSCTSLFLLPVLKTSSKDETCSFCCQNKQLRAFSCFSYDPCDTHHSSDVMTLPLFFFYFFFLHQLCLCVSWVSSLAAGHVSDPSAQVEREGIHHQEPGVSPVRGGHDRLAAVRQVDARTLTHTRFTVLLCASFAQLQSASNVVSPRRRHPVSLEIITFRPFVVFTESTVASKTRTMVTSQHILAGPPAYSVDAMLTFIFSNTATFRYWGIIPPSETPEQ